MEYVPKYHHEHPAHPSNEVDKLKRACHFLELAVQKGAVRNYISSNNIKHNLLPVLELLYLLIDKTYGGLGCFDLRRVQQLISTLHTTGTFSLYPEEKWVPYLPEFKWKSLHAECNEVVAKLNNAFDCIRTWGSFSEEAVKDFLVAFEVLQEMVDKIKSFKEFEEIVNIPLHLKKSKENE